MWLWSDRLLLVGVVALSLLLLVKTVRHWAERTLKPAAPVTAPLAVGEPTRREVVVPGGGAWVSYGRSAAACGDRRRIWSERGMTRREWQQAPAAPAVNIEPCANGYTVWCFLPGRTATDVTLRMEDDVLLVEHHAAAALDAGSLKFRLPGTAAKRISDRSFSNGWLRVSVLNVNPSSP